MSEYVLLTDQKVCPGCRARRSFLTGNCHNCGIKIFTTCPAQPQKFEDETGVRHWWAWHPIDGWKHRDHYMIEGIKPNHRVYKAPNLAKNYGKEITPGEITNRSAKSRRVRGKQEKTMPSKRFHKVY